MFCIFWSASRGSRQALLRGGQFCSKITEGGRVRISWALYLSGQNPEIQDKPL